jgi:hypothetical protein
VSEGFAELPLPFSSATTAVSHALEIPLDAGKLESNELASISYPPSTNPLTSNTSASSAFTLTQELNKLLGNQGSRESLGLFLSCYLAELHGGKISVRGSVESGYRYVVSLPQLESADERL